MDFYVMPVVNVDGYDYTWKKVGEGKANKNAPLGMQDTRAESSIKSWVQDQWFHYEKIMEKFNSTRVEVTA